MDKLQNNSKLKKKKSSPRKQSSHDTPLPIFVVRTDQEEQKGKEKKEICETIR